MHIQESHLQSKFSEITDNGGEDRLIVTDHYAAVIDGATAKTNARYLWQDKTLTPGGMAAEIILQAIPELDPEMEAKEACKFLNARIYKTYSAYNILDAVKESPVERFTAVIGLFNKAKRYVVLAGECQAVIDYKHYHAHKKVDILNAQARSIEINRLIKEDELTEEALLTMETNDDPGRKLILDPPLGSNFPGLKGQSKHQNDRYSPYGYFALDGFANFETTGFTVITVPTGVDQLILATDGYLVPQNMDGADALYDLASAEKNLNNILVNDPCLYKIYKATKGKGKYPSFDDRAYLKIKI